MLRNFKQKHKSIELYLEKEEKTTYIEVELD